MLGTKNWYILEEQLLLEWELHPDSIGQESRQKFLIQDFCFLSEAIPLQTH